MSAALETAVIALGVNGLATTGALVYTVRRVSPWPKPPAAAQAQAQGSRNSRKTGSPAGPDGDGQAPAAPNGADPARSTI